MPILGEIFAPAFADGGDKVWLDDETLIIGHGYRTNGEGIQQIFALLAPFGIDVYAFDLSHFMEPDAVLHLMSPISPITHDPRAATSLPFDQTWWCSQLATRGSKHNYEHTTLRFISFTA